MLGVVLCDVSAFAPLKPTAAIQVDKVVLALQIRGLRPKEAKIIGVGLYRWQVAALGFEPRHGGLERTFSAPLLHCICRRSPCWVKGTLERTG